MAPNINSPIFDFLENFITRYVLNAADFLAEVDGQKYDDLTFSW